MSDCSLVTSVSPTAPRISPEMSRFWGANLTFVARQAFCLSHVPFAHPPPDFPVRIWQSLKVQSFDCHSIPTLLLSPPWEGAFLRVVCFAEELVNDVFQK